MLTEIIRQKKAPSFTWGPKTTRECCPYSKNRVKFDSNESAGLPTPEQPTRLAEESARPTRVYPTKSLLSQQVSRCLIRCLLALTYSIVSLRTLNQKIQALTRLVNLAHENRLCGSDSSQEVAAHYGRGNIEYQCIALC